MSFCKVGKCLRRRGLCLLIWAGILGKVVFFVLVRLAGFVWCTARMNARLLIFLGLFCAGGLLVGLSGFLMCLVTFLFDGLLFVLGLFVLGFLVERMSRRLFVLFRILSLLDLCGLDFLLLNFVGLRDLFFGLCFLMFLLSLCWMISSIFLGFLFGFLCILFFVLDLDLIFSISMVHLLLVLILLFLIFLLELFILSFFVWNLIVILYFPRCLILITDFLDLNMQPSFVNCLVKHPLTS